MAQVYKRGKVWWVRFQHEGKRVQRSARTTRKDEALKVLVELQEKVRRRQPLDPDRHSFEEAAERFVQEHLPLLKPNSAAGYHTHIRFMLEQFQGLHLDEIDRVKIADYISSRRRAGSSSPTIRRHLATLSSVFTRAIGWGWITENPVKTIDRRAIPEARPRVRYLTRVEYRRLLAEAAPHLKPIIEVAALTGMRAEEILSLTWVQVDLDRREITLTKTKTNTPRVVPLSREAVAVFVTTPRHITSAWVFCDPLTGRRYRKLKTGFHGACRRAGIENFRFHDLRHTFASWAVQSGMDLYRLSRILGHATTQMTQRYAHLATADLHAAIEQMDARVVTKVEDSAATSIRGATLGGKPGRS